MKESAIGQTAESSEVGLLDFWEDVSAEGRASIAVFAVALLSLILVLGCEFTNWLEASLVSSNPVVTRPGFNFTWLAISAFQGYYYSPVLWVVYRIGHSLWGLSPAGYHALALVFHAGCAVLVFRLGRKLRLSLRAAALAAMLWSVHPLRVESVAWVMDLGRVMGTFFCLAGTLLMFRSADLPEKEKEGSLWLRLKAPRGETAYTLAAVLVILGMLSCSALCLWPLLILMLDALRRLPPDANGLPRVESRQEAYAILRTRFWDVTPLLIMSVIVAFMGIRAAAIGGLIDGDRLRSVGSNFLAGCYALCFHLVKVAIPVRLSAMYQLPQPISLLQPIYALSILGALACAALAVWSFRRCTWLFAGVCFFVIGLLPYLQIVPCSPAVADRYAYFSSIGLFLALGAAFGYALEKRPAKAFGGVSQVELTGYVLVVVLVLCSVARASVWADSETLWNDVLAKDPANLSARLRLCAAREANKDYKGAEDAMRPALETHPDNAAVHFGIARLLMEQENYQEAEHHLERGIALKPEDVRGKQLKVELPLRKGDLKEAVENLKPLIDIETSMPTVYKDIGKLFQRQGGQSPAIACFQRALKDATDDQKPDLLINTGISLVGMGRPDLALEQYRKALQYDPKNLAALLNAASICRDMNIPQDAFQYLQRAIIVDRANPYLHKQMKEFADRYPQFLRQYEQQMRR